MTAPTNHHLTVTDRDGKRERGKVVCLEPKAERRRDERIEVHILCSDWLNPYAYKAIYNTPTESVAGTFAVHSYISESDLWRFGGTFERADC